MAGPTLHDGIEQAGSAVDLLWKPGTPAWTPEVVEKEYAGWKAEQHAWFDTVTIADLSHHMSDTVVEGPEATKTLAATSANNYESFVIGQAKQFVPIGEGGNIITDGILFKESEERYVLSGVPAAQNWVMYHARKLGFDVVFDTNRETSARPADVGPMLFRYQIQGPLAGELIERAFGSPLPATKFLHSTLVSLEDRTFRALRHGMAGQPGFEFLGDWADAAFVKDALMKAGEPFGLVHQGALSYPTSCLGSGWIPSPTPAIYTDTELLDYRKSIPLYSYEGMKPLQGSFYSDNIEDYYTSPYELGYGRSISFNHDFIGRSALAAAEKNTSRTKVTLVFDKADIHRVLGEDPGFVHHYWRNRVEAKDALVGVTFQSGWLDTEGTVLALAVIDKKFAEPGTRVEVVWGEHPGAGTAPDADLGFPRLHATVQPCPFDEMARTLYRRNAG
ncbi:aminomethyltransferase family protein [Nocardia vaccinii]|uniref:aminomethyltransferase family protein n=1 Tax=Nocardia vaccinii TaxID=1822 RepID=UPI000835020B|nr:aminomethyltransferase family protein [Nocardia vaccinii]